MDLMRAAVSKLGQCLKSNNEDDDVNIPAAFYLVGDSTTAVQSSDGGGWGSGFLGTLNNGSTGVNCGHNGATTVSFKEWGDWARTMNQLKVAKRFYHDVYVTIQFGHNDQNDFHNITLADYKNNLKQMASEIRNAGCHPILVTPISRRNFDSSNGRVTEDLAEYAAATIEAASAAMSYCIDLNKASTLYLNQIGQADAAKYNLVPGDVTHLNDAGSVVFGNMVSLLMADIPDSGESLGHQTVPDPEIAKAIEKGIFIYPSNSITS